MDSVTKCFNCLEGDFMSMAIKEDLTKEGKLKFVCTSCGAVYYIEVTND